MCQIIKIRIASKTDKEMYMKMLKAIDISKTQKIIEEDSCVIYYDSKTHMIAYKDGHEDTNPRTFNDLKSITVEDFYYNCKTDYNIYFFEDEEKIKNLYVKWFDKKFYDEVDSSENDIVDRYGHLISELKTRLKSIKDKKPRELRCLNRVSNGKSKEFNYDNVIIELKSKLNYIFP